MTFQEKAKQLIDAVHQESLYCLVAPTEKAQLKHRHRALKHKGGHPPTDYILAEAVVDLEYALEQEDASRARGLYYWLRRRLNY